MGFCIAIWALLGAAVEVSGTAGCPSPAQVQAQLLELGDKPSPGPLRLLAELEETGEGLRVRLRSPDGEEVAQRLLTGSASCEERAAATAVMLQSWAREVEAQGVPEGSPVPPMPQEDLPGAQRGEDPLLPPAQPQLFADVTLGLSASLGGRQVALGGALTLALTSFDRRIGAQLRLAALGVRRTVGEQATFERFALTLSPHYRLPVRQSAVDLHLGGAAGLFALVPEVGRARAAVEPGLTAGVRMLGKGGLWAGLCGYFWPVSQPLPGGQRAPLAELVLSGGLAWSGP